MTLDPQQYERLRSAVESGELKIRTIDGEPVDFGTLEDKQARDIPLEMIVSVSLLANPSIFRDFRVITTYTVVNNGRGSVTDVIGYTIHELGIHGVYENGTDPAADFFYEILVRPGR